MRAGLTQHTLAYISLPSLRDREQQHLAGSGQLEVMLVGGSSWGQFVGIVSARRGPCDNEEELPSS